MRVVRIISGGQSGVDYGALLGARSIGIPTGGFAPRGWKTEIGSRPELGSLYNLIQCDGGYKERTCMNIEAADATLIIVPGGAGTRLTIRECKARDAVYNTLKYDDIRVASNLLHKWITYDLDDVFDTDVTDELTLNIAGPRESKQKGITRWTTQLVRSALEQ